VSPAELEEEEEVQIEDVEKLLERKRPHPLSLDVVS